MFQKGLSLEGSSSKHCERILEVDQMLEAYCQVHQSSAYAGLFAVEGMTKDYSKLHPTNSEAVELAVVL